jgi:hypothetical protein
MYRWSRGQELEVAEKVKYALGSSPAIYAPGIVAWAVNGAKFKKDVPQMAKVIAEGWGVPVAAAKALVLGKVPYKIEGEAVVFEA